ncbi:hypothetical protein ACFSKL_13100 [Belliella marina]|uniref:Lipoprotein n=1 Tax=Belliella marina TaxID=1644146 RepID=A0ABW4VM52_9BACT
MKNILKMTPILLLLAALTCSCQNEINPDCEGDNAQQVELFYVDEFESTPCGLQNIEGNEKETNLVITTQADFEKFFTCSEQLHIDFDKYFILAGMYRHHQCAVFDSQQVVLCNNRIVYKVGLLEQICAALTNVSYFVVIDKQYENLPVVFDVKFSN